jgi:hypothetical protein
MDFLKFKEQKAKAIDLSRSWAYKIVPLAYRAGEMESQKDAV